MQPRPRVAITVSALMILLAACTRGSREQSGLVGPWYDAMDAPLPQSHPMAIEVFQGSEHCQWQGVDFLVLAWPLGFLVQGSEMGNPHTRVFVRDPDGLIQDDLTVGTFEPHSQVPNNAYDTGYHRGSWHLWVDEALISEGVWLVNAATIERWPAATQVFGCV